jgi:RNA polymerase sigma factor, sigma-70 family
MERLRAGEKDSLGGIYDLTFKSVYLLSRSILKDSSAAEDAAQNVYIRISANIDKYSPGTNALAWIMRMARNICYRELERRKRVDFTEDMPSEPADESGLEGLISNADLSRALESLSDEEREIVVMFALEDYKHREIAEILGRPAGTVRWLYGRAVKKLRKIYEEQGYKKSS